MEVLAHTRIVSWEGASLWVIDATNVVGDKPRRTDFHAHHAIQVTFGLGGCFKLDTADLSVRGEAVAVAADTPHVFEAEGLIAMIFIEPESRFGRAVARDLFAEGKLAVVPRYRLEQFCTGIRDNFRAAKRDDENLVTMGRGLVASMAAGRAQEPDARVRRIRHRVLARSEPRARDLRGQPSWSILSASAWHWPRGSSQPSPDLTVTARSIRRS